MKALGQISVLFLFNMKQTKKTERNMKHSESLNYQSGAEVMNNVFIHYLHMNK